MRFNNIDVSSEMIVWRLGDGIVLTKPAQFQNKKLPLIKTGHTIASLLKLPFNVYFIRHDGTNICVNEIDAMTSGFDSVQGAIGRPCFNKFTRQSAAITTQNDKKVMQLQKIKISEEEVVLSEGQINRPTLSIKLPWYNQENEIVGIFGCSILLGQNPLAESLSLVKNLGVLNAPNMSFSRMGIEVKQHYLSKRQLDCAKLLLAGKSHKEIAAHLNLSTRTVEHYFFHIKEKLHCKNRTELIIKLKEIL